MEKLNFILFSLTKVWQTVLLFYNNLSTFFLKNMQRPTWAEIHLDNLAFNLKSIKSFVGKDLKFIA